MERLVIGSWQVAFKATYGQEITFDEER